MLIPLIAQAQNPLIISNGLLGYWSFNEATGDFAFDYSGNNRLGTLSGSPIRVQGKTGRAISFNGTDQHVNLGSFLSGETEFSFVVWLKPTALENWAGIIAKYVDDNNCVTLQTEADGKIAFDVDQATAVNNYGETNSSALLVDGAWAHIAMTYNGAGATNADRVQIYVNGAPKTIDFTGDIATSTITGSTMVVVGALNEANLVALSGVIDDVRIYNRQLKETEVKQLYISSFGGGSLHPRVIDWAFRVQTNGGAMPSENTLRILSNFYRRLDDTGLTPKMQAVTCLVPDNLIASITPLIKTVGNDPWTNTNFVAADLTINGLVGNASNKYLDTGINVKDSISDFDCGATIYVSANPSAAEGAFKNELGANQGAPTYASGFSIYSTLQLSSVKYIISEMPAANGGVTVSTSSLYTGYISANRTTSSLATLYLASSGLPHYMAGSNTSSYAAWASDCNVAIAAYAWRSPAGVANYSDRRMSFIAIHKGLTQNESLTLYNLVQSMRQSFGGGWV